MQDLKENLTEETLGAAEAALENSEELEDFLYDDWRDELEPIRKPWFEDDGDYEDEIDSDDLIVLGVALTLYICCQCACVCMFANTMRKLLQRNRDQKYQVD